MGKILVVDDEKPILSMFKLFLGLYGHKVYTAESGQEGLELFLKTKPDAVFVDIKMPGMDGFEVLKQIKTKAPATEVILITGHGDKNLAQRALDMQADDFIHKPFQEEALTDALERLAQRQNQKPKK